MQLNTTEFNIKRQQATMKTDTFSRFSSKSEKYAKYRPDYAQQAIQTIFEQTQLTNESVIADIGAGTGIVSQHFVENSNLVYAVEPSQGMRQMAEIRLGKSPFFHSVDGTSEATTLPDASIDLITVGQAMHWFNPKPTKREFLRILKENGSLAILDRSSFLRYSVVFDEHYKVYEELEREFNRVFVAENGWGINPDDVKFISIFPQRDKRPFEWYFAEDTLLRYAFTQPTHFSQEQLVGWLASLANAPDETHQKYSAFAEAVQEVFNKLQDRGKVTIPLTTNLYLGKMR